MVETHRERQSGMNIGKERHSGIKGRKDTECYRERERQSGTERGRDRVVYREGDRQIGRERGR